MTDTKELLRSAIGRAEPPIPPLESVLRRTAGRRRRERVVAAGVALTLTAALGTGLAFLLRDDGASGPSNGNDVVGPTRQVYIPSESMTPTLQVGDTVLVDEGAYRATGGIPERGDIVAFAVPELAEQDFVKRVVGLPGDVVEERDGEIYVNDALVALPEGDRPSVDLGPFTVQPACVFVVGDHLANSNDSRYGMGQIPLRLIVGKVVEILSPDDRRATVEPPAAPAVSGPADGGSG